MIAAFSIYRCVRCPKVLGVRDEDLEKDPRCCAVEMRKAASSGRPCPTEAQKAPQRLKDRVKSAVPREHSRGIRFGRRGTKRSAS